MSLPIILKQTIFGLSKPYFIRQIVIALILTWIPAIFVVFSQTSNGKNIFIPQLIIMLTFLTLVFPYARFGLQSIVRIIIGNNIIIYNILWKFVGIVIAFMFWFILAPIGIIFIFLEHRKMNQTTVAKSDR